MRTLSFLFIAAGILLLVGGCSSCASQVACSANGDCGDGQVCAASAEGSFCVPEGSEGEGEGEGEPTVSLVLQNGALEGDEVLEVTVAWTLSAVSGCELQSDGVALPEDLESATSAALTIEDSQVLQIVCDEAVSQELAFVVHDVSEITGPAAVIEGTSIVLAFSVASISTCAVTTDGIGANLTQPTISGADGSFTDIADADKSYTLSCTGSEGPIVRSFDLNVLTVADVSPPPEIVGYGEPLSVVIDVEPGATCALASAAADGSDRRIEDDAAEVIDGETRTFTLAAALQVRTYFVECTVADATVESGSTLVRIRPRIVNFDARIPDIEALDGDAATLELLVSVIGLEAGGSCAVHDGATDTPNAGTNVVLTSGPPLAVYTLRCSAAAPDPAPATAGGFQVLWRAATEADLAALAASRFAMADVLVDNATVSSIDTGLLEQVGGNLTFASLASASGPIAIQMPALRDVGAALTVRDTPSAASLTMDSLRTLDQLWIDNLDGIAELAVPSLALADGGFAGLWVFNCGNLEAVDLPVLTGTGGVRVGDNPSLQRFSAPTLIEVGALTFTGNPSLSELALPALAHASGALDFENIEMQTLSLPALETIDGGITVASCGALRTLSLPLLQSTGSGSIYISGNASLNRIDTFVLLNTDPAGNFTVTSNPALPCAEVADLYCPLLTRDITPSISNNAAASCPAVHSGC